jgi:cell division protein FtsQ
MVRQQLKQYPHKVTTIAWPQAVKILSYIITLSLIFCFLYELCHRVTFPIAEVKVFGAQHLNQQELQHELVPFVRKGFFGVEVAAIKDQLLQLPWVADVSVQRIWPNEVTIHITERQPIAHWNGNSLLSSKGEIFTPGADSYRESLPEFIGPTGEQAQLLEYYQKINLLLTPLHFKVARLELTAYQTWNIVFDTGVKVNVGYKDVLTRLSHFVKVYPKIIGERAAQVEYIDLRYQDGLAIRWKTIT